MSQRNNIYFISDLHLGLHPAEKSREREKIVVQWLKGIKDDAKELYLLGDVFDYWFEYKRVVPRGFTRFLGMLAELADSGVIIYYFIGNHDIWVYDYLKNEIGLTVCYKPITKEIFGKKFFIGHGDGLGKYEWKYRVMNSWFKNGILEWLFRRIHPETTVAFGLWWSKKSRYAKGIIPEQFKGIDKEHQVLFARDVLQKEFYDYFIFGHRHIPYDVTINGKTRVINTGDWITYFTYVKCNESEVVLQSLYPEKNKEIYAISFNQ